MLVHLFIHSVNSTAGPLLYAGHCAQARHTGWTTAHTVPAATEVHPISPLLGNRCLQKYFQSIKLHTKSILVDYVVNNVAGKHCHGLAPPSSILRESCARSTSGKYEKSYHKATTTSQNYGPGIHVGERKSGCLLSVYHSWKVRTDLHFNSSFLEQKWLTLKIGMGNWTSKFDGLLQTY